MKTHRVVAPLAVLALTVGCATARRSVTKAEPQQADRTIVRTGLLSVEVTSLDSARSAAAATASQFGAEKERENTDKRRITLRYRVPEARLDSAMTALSILGDVTARSSSAVDKSLEAADLDARIQNLIASRDRLRALAERAEGVPDVVTVERELARVQGELESLEAQRRVLREQATLAALDLTLEQRVVLGPVGKFFQGAGTLIGRLFVRA